MSEIVNASAVRFDDLPPTGDGYTLLSINGKVHKSDKLLSEMVQSAVDKQVEDKLDTTAFSTVSGNFLTAHQKISANEWNSCYETVSANSGIWGTQHDWITEIKDASANAFNEASAWVEEQNYITGVDLSNYYTKNETSSKNELNLAFDTKQDKGDYYSASNPSGFLTAHQSLEDYAKKEWIEKRYYNVDEINNFLDEKYDTSSFAAVSGTFLTAHQDLSNFYTKDETSGSQQLADTFNTKQNNLTFAGENNTITAINSSAIGGGSNNSWKEWSEELSSSGNDSIYIGTEDSAYQNSIALGDSAFAISGGAVIGKNSIGGRDGYVIGDDNKIKIWNNTSSQYLDLDTSNVINDDYTLKNPYYFVPQYAFGVNNTVNHGKGPYIGDYGIMPFQIGCDNMVLDLLDYNSMQQNLGIGATYNIGRANSAVNAGINIGGNNKILTGDGSVGASINIGKRLTNNFGVLIGQDLSSFGWGIGIGERSYINNGSYAFGLSISAGQGSFTFGDTITAGAGTFGIGRSISSYNGSFVVGYSNLGFGGSMVFGTANSASGASFAIGKSNKPDFNSFVFGEANSAEQCSYAFGYGNNVKRYTIAIGYNNTNSTLAGQSFIFGKQNTISGSDPNNTQYGFSTTLIGTQNTLSLNSGDTFYGIILGDENTAKAISNTAYIGGYNIYLGKGNKGSEEAINIGTLNDSVGHSISLGWNNTANTNRFAHTIMIGKANSADTNKSDLRPNKPFRVVDNGILTDTTDNPETNSFIVGTNNSASHYNSIIIGSKNQTLSAVPNPDAEPGEELYDDDGFTVALGLGNIAARNYDMAIGYSTLASGGENIAIGAPQEDPYYGLLWHTNAVGYRNIAIRSNVSGIGNIAFESNFEGKGINNVILNSQIRGTTDGDSDYPYARNDIRYSNGILNVGNDFTDNVIKTTTANIDCKVYCVNNTIQNSYIDITVNDVMISNFINTTTATGTTDTFRHNVIFFSDIDVTSGDYNFSYYDKEQNHSNFLVGVSARNVIGTFGFADKSLNSLQEVVRSYSFGDNHLNRVRESTVFGQSNYLSSTDKSFVVGNGNSIHVPCSGSSDEPASMELIIGFDNIMEYSSITSTNCRNKIIGNTNQFYSDGETTDNFIIGNNNKFFYFDSIPDNREYGYPELPYYADENTFACYRNMVFGTYNAVSQYISNGFIVGDSNVIMTDNVSDKSFNKTRSKYDSSIVFGFGNVAYNGSKQIAMGDFNTVSGHFAYAFGEDLSAQDFQMVVGKYNAPVPKTTRTTSAWVNDTVVELENSGVVFAIGNGRLNCYEKDGEWYDGIDEIAITNPYDESLITRSNALTVSANGVVSASDYITSGNYKLSELNEIIDFLRNKPSTGTYVMKCIDGTLTWVVDNT